GELEPAGPPHARDVAWSQPDLSPDGSVICCGYLGGFRSNWTLHYVRPGAPEEENPLTSPDMALYDPAWSPDGQLIACTGFAAGDPGWGIYVIEPTTGQRARLDAGEGNCRHPVWAPDGTQIIFESDRGGTYDLYRMSVPEVSFPEADGEAEQPLKQVLALSFEDGGDGEDVVPDLSGSGNDGRVVEELTWTEDGAHFGDGFVAVPEPSGCDFGTGAFTVMAEITILGGADETRIVMVGDYPEHHLGWQIFVNAEGYGYFNARSPGGGFIGPRSTEPLPHGQRIRLTGVRHEGGECELYVDGVRQRPSVPGGTMQYGDANRIHVGAQYSGGMRFDGIIHRVEVHRGSVYRARISEPVLREFLGR
ncbi:MAG: LamG-like jellyroll fold domain-containing protein, partial [Gemmatimonadota bacterium]|nr:LamG-like jellyroll fold domain-containing protein [Gemmatimonadota bacterium]